VSAASGRVLKHHDHQGGADAVDAEREDRNLANAWRS
jgi:hypothetical protein